MSRVRRVIRLDELQEVSPDDIIEKKGNITSFIESNKKIRKNQRKMQEIGLYLNCLEKLNNINNELF